jgi:uncharacterized SAM-binding protein YcdF (DUF218 family)
MITQVSRFFAPLLDPHGILIWLLLASCLLALAQARRSALTAVLFAMTLMVLASWKPLPQTFLRPLESRFPSWQDAGADVVGIVILGGALDGEAAAWIGSGLSNATGRITEGVFLARRFPQARILYAGGGETVSEADQGRLLLGRLGVDLARIVIEPNSRTTAENAAFACSVAHRRPGDRWLLITSAWHMPRAVGAFRAVGFEVEAYPVDYRAMPTSDLFDLGAGLELLRIGLKEYLGLIAYWIAGRTVELFPGPFSKAPDVPTRQCGTQS